LKILQKIEPSPKQRLFFKAKQKYIAYGGARGGGKSWAMRTKCWLLAIKYPNIKILLLRRTFPELEANHIIPLLLTLKGIAKYIIAKKMFVFPNGSHIKLGYCKSEADALQYQGAEYDVICFEEATLFTESQLFFISTALRTSTKRATFSPRIYYTCNPGGVGHAYIKRLFIDRDYTPTENPDEYLFIPASVYDNKVLMEADPTYISVLDNLPEELRRAHRDGDWDALSGQFFSEFRRDIHVIEPFEIPEEWDRYITVDYGLDMAAVYWIAVNFKGLHFVYRELHEASLIVSEVAAKIKQLTGQERIRATYVPWDLKSRSQDTGKSAYDIFLEHGIIGITAKVDRMSGWLCLKEALKPPSPKMLIFNNCKMLIRNLPILQRSAQNPNDVALIPHDLTHCADSIRYFVSAMIKLPQKQSQLTLSGTYSMAELLMKGYTKGQIHEMANKGTIRVI
jgi:phage terminase large subunit